eukprot:357444-Chlamydomonas_euryale.AAC.5
MFKVPFLDVLCLLRPWRCGRTLSLFCCSLCALHMHAMVGICGLWPFAGKRRALLTEASTCVPVQGFCLSSSPSGSLSRRPPHRPCRARSAAAALRRQPPTAPPTSPLLAEPAALRRLVRSLPGPHPAGARRRAHAASGRRDNCRLAGGRCARPRASARVGAASRLSALRGVSLGAYSAACVLAAARVLGRLRAASRGGSAIQRSIGAPHRASESRRGRAAAAAPATRSPPLPRRVTVGTKSGACSLIPWRIAASSA